MKDDYPPTALCKACLTKLDACFQLFQLRIKGDRKFQSYQSKSVGIPIKRRHSQSVMHGDHKSFSFKMEEDIRNHHPKKRKMRQYLLLEGSHETPATSIHTPQPPQQPEPLPQTCMCEECTHAKYGELPLLADVIASQSQAEDSVTNSDTSASNYSYCVNESGSSSFVNVPLVPVPSAEKVDNKQQTSSTAECTSPVQTLPKEDVSGPSTSTKREIPCDYCGKTFTHTGDLNKHRRTHTGERPYNCQQCDKKFSHASNLLRHQKIHSGERPFTCSFCGKGFSRKDKMLSHKKSSTCTKRSDTNVSPHSTSS